MKYEINDKSNYIRIDKYLMNLLNLTRSKVQEMIKLNYVEVNNKKIKNSYILKQNDIVNIKKLLETDVNIEKEKMNLDIVYEDEYIIVINKPSGLVVHPGDGNLNHTLVNGLLYYTDNLSDINGEERRGIVHRIDKDTSGLLVVAKTNEAHEKLSNQLKDKSLSRVYIALVLGKINHDTGTIDAPIGRDINDRKKMCVTDINSKDAITHFKVLERYKNSTLLEVHLETGRTHQIRVHMKYIGHPIINDPVYNNKKATDFGQMLHASKISFMHPITNKQMMFETELPKEFIEILDKYKNE